MSEAETPIDIGYTPRVGDLVEWKPWPGWARRVVARDAKLAEPRWEVVAVGADGSDDGNVGVARERSLSPLRPTAVGQRVRWALASDDDTGEVTSIGERVGVRWSSRTAVFSYRADRLVRVAEPKARGFAEAQREDIDAMMGRATAAPEIDCRRVEFVPLHDAGVEYRRLPFQIVNGATGATGLADQAIEALRQLGADWRARLPAGTEVTASPIAARHAGHCPTCHRATRAKGETRLHWWACGCAVEAEGVESAAGNLEDGTARDVFVWGGSAYGSGWTLDEAIVDWRAALAPTQVFADAGLELHDNAPREREARAKRAQARRAAANRALATEEGIAWWRPPRGRPEPRVLTVATPGGSLCGRGPFDVVRLLYPQSPAADEWERAEVHARLARDGRIERVVAAGVEGEVPAGTLMVQRPDGTVAPAVRRG